MTIKEYLEEKELDRLFLIVMLSMPHTGSKEEYYRHICDILNTELSGDLDNFDPLEVFVKKYSR